VFLIFVMIIVPLWVVYRFINEKILLINGNDSR
jgi:hypothetical protein